MGRPDDLERARRWELVPALLLLAILVYLVVSRLLLRAEAFSQPAAALISLPPAWFWYPVGVLTALLGLLALYSAATQGPAVRVRIFYVYGVLALFLQVFVLPDVRFPPLISADGMGAAALTAAAHLLSEASVEGRLPEDMEVVESAFEGMVVPAYYSHGERVEDWAFSTRTGCTAPPEDPGPLRVGTLLWCVSGDRTHGWVTLFGTGGRETGAVAVGRALTGQPLVIRVEPPAPD